jgi:glycosyltransferase involved in cell wall biosynthesis
VEALACGTPVAACDVPALREVLGGRVALSAIDDLDGLVRDAEALSRPAPAPPDWSWADAARATWTVYHEALSAPASRLRPGLRHAGGRSPNGGPGPAKPRA